MQSGTDELTIIKEMEPRDRLILKFVGQGMLNDDIAKVMRLDIGNTKKVVDSVIDRLSPNGVQVNAMSRYLVTKRWEEFARIHTITQDGEIARKDESQISETKVAKSELIPPTEPPVEKSVSTKVELPSAPPHLSNETNLSEYVARAADVGKLSPYLLRTLAFITQSKEPFDRQKIATELGVSRAAVYTYWSTLTKKLQLGNVTGDRQLLIMKAMYQEWVRTGSITIAPKRSSYSNGRVNVEKRISVEAKTPPVVFSRPAVQDVPRTIATPTALPARQLSQPVSISVQLPSPEQIDGLPVSIVLGAPGAAEKAASLMKKGYVPEVFNEYLWPSATEHITTILLVKRVTK